MLFSIKSKIARQFIFSALLISLVSGICFSFSNFIDSKMVAFILLVVVSVLASLLEILPVLFSAILSALLWDFLFVEPRFTFSVGSIEDRMFLLMYFIIALINAVLTFKIKQYKKEISKKTEEANAIKLYDTILNSLSHELKTPLATIIGTTDTLRENIKILDEKNISELLNEISEASLRLDVQVSNLLNVSRLETGSLKIKTDWCDVTELIHNTLNSINNTSHSIILDIEPGIPLVKLDYGLLETTLFNLIKNAIFYTPENSEIIIILKLCHSSSGHFENNNKRLILDSKVSIFTICISDNGPGIKVEDINSIFDKFYRSNNAKTGGTGLGLSIVKGFVEAHNGTITVINNDKGGATFTISIPTETNYINSLKNE